jgi:hypothetical protein
MPFFPVEGSNENKEHLQVFLECVLPHRRDLCNSSFSADLGNTFSDLQVFSFGERRPHVSDPL